MKCQTCSLFETFLGSSRLFRTSSVKNESEADGTGKSAGERLAFEERASDARQKILNGALDFVPKLGWSTEALAEGAKLVGYPNVAHGMFPKGGVELVHHFYAECNGKLAEYLEQHSLLGDRQPALVTELIQNSVRQRLEMIVPHLDNWPQALALLSSPRNAEQSLKNLYTLVDDIWYHAGDRSVNSNFYTRRLGLATLYTTTELVLVRDRSAEFAETWEFLHRNLKRMEEVGEGLKSTGRALEGLPSFIQGSLITLRNVAGLRTIV